MIVEVEETCARLGVAIRAIVRNVEGKDYALARELVIAASDITPEIASSPYLIPIFTPGHRLAAFHDASSARISQRSHHRRSDVHRGPLHAPRRRYLYQRRQS